MRWLISLLLLSAPASADGERAGDFDYYVMSLSWSPTFCALEGDRRGNPQCEEEGRGWVLHGLWPQYEEGWPAYCMTDERNPSRRDTAEEAGLFGSSGSAWHQWNKHGRCSGLPADDYYDLSQAAYDSIERPEIFRQLEEAVRLPASVVEEAFLEANTSLRADMVTVTCDGGRIEEVRICLTRNLEPRVCGQDVQRDCRMTDALLEPMR